MLIPLSVANIYPLKILPLFSIFDKLVRTSLYRIRITSRIKFWKTINIDVSSSYAGHWAYDNWCSVEGKWLFGTFILHTWSIPVLEGFKYYSRVLMLVIVFLCWLITVFLLFFKIQLDDSVVKTIEIASNEELKESRDLILRIRRRNLYQVLNFSFSPFL